MAVETHYAKGVVFIGAAHEHPVEVKDQAGLPANMAGWTLLYVLRAPDGSMVMSKTTGGGITLSNGAGANSRANVSWGRSDTLAAQPGYHDWALWRTDDPSDQPLAYGRMYLTKVAQQP